MYITRFSTSLQSYLLAVVAYLDSTRAYCWGFSKDIIFLHYQGGAPFHFWSAKNIKLYDILHLIVDRMMFMDLLFKWVPLMIRLIICIKKGVLLIVFGLSECY